MSYVTYTTEALVCGSFEQNTADKSFLLFTRELGMLFATARSVREESSKQRFALQDFSRVRVSLIKGKTGWRVGSVEVIKNDFSLAPDRETRGSVVSFYKLLRRFIRGEEALAEVYDFSITALNELSKQAPNRKLLDLYIQIKVLSLLGYVDEETLPAPLKNLDLDVVSTKVDDKIINKLEIIIAKAADSSHL